MIPPIFSLIGSLIIRPKLAFKMVLVERRGIGQAFLVLLISHLGLSGSVAMALSSILSMFAYFVPQLRWLAHLIVGGVVVVLVPIFIIIWLITMLLTYALARAFGGEGDLESTAVVMAFSEVVAFIPVLFALPALFSSLIGLLIYILGLIIWAIWNIVLKSIGISEAHNLSIGKSVAAVLLTHFILIVIPLIIFLPLMVIWGV